MPAFFSGSSCNLLSLRPMSYCYDLADIGSKCHSHCTKDDERLVPYEMTSCMVTSSGRSEWTPSLDMCRGNILKFAMIYTVP